MAMTRPGGDAILPEHPVPDQSSVGLAPEAVATSELNLEEPLQGDAPPAYAYAPGETPEDLLVQASRAPSPALRAQYARWGLAHPSGLEIDTRALLLRQLYLAQLEQRQFRKAKATALQVLSTGVLPDVAHQDAARAYLGLGNPAGAVLHLRVASRVAPPSRRASHQWALGSLLYLSGQFLGATEALQRALRWGTGGRPLYRAQLALAQLQTGQQPEADLVELRRQLAEAPCAQGYGQFVLGELSYFIGDKHSMHQHLSTFIQGVTGGRVALQVTLGGELRRAQELLARS